MVLHNPNNWHWVSKDVRPWTQDYLSKELVGIKAEKDGASAEVSRVLSLDGDVEVSQRKGKVITIFDFRLQLEYTGKVPVKAEAEGQENDSKDVSGTITIPEVAHDTEEDEYVVCILSQSPQSNEQRSWLTCRFSSKWSSTAMICPSTP